jgi:DNA adenine methylase
VSECVVPRLNHYTPLRYPGGKGKLAPYIKKLLAASGCADGVYVEPYAGGAAIALELLFHEYVDKIHINDISVPVFAFWKSVTEYSDRLCKLIEDTPIDLQTWREQRAVFFGEDQSDVLRLGFAAFFLNRTNRSGIFNGGVIGGINQAGTWKMDARYNRKELAFRVRQISRLKSRITVTNLDAVRLIRAGSKKWSEKTFIYCDPPYYIQGSQLYYNFYKHEDHLKVAEAVTEHLVRQRWVVSYDNVPEIRSMYDGFNHITYSIGYSARSTRTGREILFFGPSVPPLDTRDVAVMRQSRRTIVAPSLRA